MTPFEVLLVGAAGIYSVHRVLSWMDRRGWISYRGKRGTASALGNAMLQVHSIYQPAMRDVLEARLEEPTEAAESGDPPEPGARADAR